MRALLRGAAAMLACTISTRPTAAAAAAELAQEVQVNALGVVEGKQEDALVVGDGEHAKLGTWGVVGTIDDVDHIPTAREFWEDYVGKWKPLIVRGAGASMPAAKLWDLDFLGEKYGNLTVRVEAAHENRRNPNNIKGGMLLSDLMNKGASGEDVYAISNVPDPM